MTENPRHPFKGMQDPQLEVRRSWRDKVTPTTSKDLSPRATLLRHLVVQGAFHSMAIEGCRGDTSNPFLAQSEEAARTNRDEARELFVAGNTPGSANLHDWETTFKVLVAGEVRHIKQKAKIEAEQEALTVGIQERTLFDLRTHYRDMSRGRTPRV